jgi:uncharacterized membrane protein
MMARGVFARLRADRGGAVTMIAAGSLLASAGCLAFAVDLGSVYFESRRLQGIADAAALSAASELDAPRTAADAAIRLNGWAQPYGLTVETGAYRPDPAVAAAARFTGGAAEPDAVRVTIASETPLFFAAVFGHHSASISRSATAARANLASFSIGSRLLALRGGIANALLGALTGSQINLSVMDYDALLSADVDLLAFTQALRTRLNLHAASYDQVLATSVTTGDAIQALATGLDAGGSGAAAGALRKLAASTPGTSRIELGTLIDLGPMGAGDHTAIASSIQANSFDLLRSMLALANGRRQVDLDLGANVPGLASVTAKLSVGDRMADSPWIAVTTKGEPVVRTAQTRLALDAKILPTANLLGIARVHLPILIELAEGEAKLDTISCRGRMPQSVSLLARPAPGHIAIADIPADISDHRTPLAEQPAAIVALPLVTVSGQARVDLAAPGWQSVAFDANDIATRRVRTIESSSLVQGLVGSLVSGLDLKVHVAGIGLGVGPVAALVGNSLATAAPALDDIINTLTGLLGVHLGEADLRVNGVRCGVPALVA